MSPVKNGRVIFNEVPKGFPEPGKTMKYDDSETIDPDTVALNGSFLLKILCLSNDPYLRGKMRDASVKSYSPAFEIGKPLYNYGVGVVLRSENPDVKVGDHLYGIYPFQEYVIKEDAKAFKVLKNEEKLPWSVYVGTCGMPGKTAYMGWKAFSKAQKGETLFVSTGAGPVGSLVIQLAKLDGLKVIASAGSEEKVNFMKKIGADVAFNYKTQSTVDVLAEHGPIDVYWDHVGGETLDAALGAAASFARFIECGMISAYNTPPGQEPYGIKNLIAVFSKSLTIRGFIVGNLDAEYADEFYREVPAWVAGGQVKYVEDVTRGLEGVGQAIADLQMGKNKGKSVIVLADQ